MCNLQTVPYTDHNEIVQSLCAAWVEINKYYYLPSHVIVYMP